MEAVQYAERIIEPQLRSCAERVLYLARNQEAYLEVMQRPFFREDLTKDHILQVLQAFHPLQP